MNRLWLSVAIMIVLASCAADIPRKSATLIPPGDSNGQPKLIQMDQEAVVQLPSGYTRSIRAGSVWRERGTVEDREVYQAARGVFTIEGTHIHEAYLLLQGNTLVGFYLPGESAVSWLKKKVILKFH